MAKIPSAININIQHLDKQVIFRSTGETDLRAGEGTPATATGDPKNNNAVVHGTVPGSSVVFNSPA